MNNEKLQRAAAGKQREQECRSARSFTFAKEPNSKCSQVPDIGRQASLTYSDRPGTDSHKRSVLKMSGAWKQAEMHKTHLPFLSMVINR